jgi:predicted nucleic acid-binding protein
MIVLDASALVELLLGTESGRSIASRIADPEVALHVPHVADLEVAETLRRFVRDGDLDAEASSSALENLQALDVQRHAHEPLLGRIWALRENLTAYDAAYVTLAEVLDATLLTCDAKLSRAPGVAVRAELIA